MEIIKEKKVLVKVHESYRKVVAICDHELLGKTFSEGKMQLEVNNHFYNGDELTLKEAEEIIRALEKDTPTYNIVGKRAVDICLRLKLIDESGVMKVSGVPLAMVF